MDTQPQSSSEDNNFEHIEIRAFQEQVEEERETNNTDDAISHHQPLPHSHIRIQEQQELDILDLFQFEPHQHHNLHNHNNHHLHHQSTCFPYASTEPGLGSTSDVASIWSHALSEPSLRARHNSWVSEYGVVPFDYRTYHGPSALEEEEAALNHGQELAAKARSMRSFRSSVSSLPLARRRSSKGGEAGAAAADNINTQESDTRITNEDGINNNDLDDEECGNCFSGICLPESQFFRTSVICSNTMARDGFANERTFLAWLNTCTALCLVAFTFISRAFTLAVVDPVDEDSQTHKNKLQRAIGYVCFICAFLACFYALFHYLRTIKRISTRYPFAQSSKWTYTVGMFIGIMTMTIIVLTYTRNL